MEVKELKEARRHMFAQMEQQLFATMSEEDRLFYLHSSEDRIVLSHALFWVMSQSLKGKIRQEKFLLLLRQYEEKYSMPISPRMSISLTCCTIATSCMR